MSSSSNSASTMTIERYIYSLFIPNEEIESATNNFADENLISQGTTTGVKLYKGQLISESGQLINIVARHDPYSSASINEVHISYNGGHSNISSLFKLCKRSSDDGLILISKYVANGSLKKYLSGSTLTWMQRLHICVGVAHALSYLHNYTNSSIIHGNIKSSKILLDDQWEPKLSGFGYSMLVTRGDVHRSSEYWDMSAYRDPAYNDTNSLSPKSDVFSFGVVLFEVLFGREASSSTPPNEEKDNWYFARLARQHYEEKTLDDMIHPDLRKQMDLQSLSIFSETAYFCLKEVRSQRPDINQVVRKLENALQLQQKHDQTQEHSTAVALKSRLSSHLEGKNVDHLKIPLSDIQLATQHFSKRYKIGSGGFGMVYKADLYHFDGTKSSAIEAKIEGKFPTVCNTVAIKRISKREDFSGEQGFIAEIEMLSNCKHPNVVSLLGYCDEGPEMILIYEYASNGSLESYLGNPDNLINFSWPQRIQICLDIAHGLSYLHTSTEEKERIIHRDIKSANVLLDRNWVAKIADFGLSKLRDANQQRSTILTNHIAGTNLYVDPEYIKTGKLKRASDIYSFGVVLFEILCGKLANDSSYCVNNVGGLPSIVARQPFNKQILKKMVDPKIMEADANILKITGVVDQDSLDTFITIAYKCLAETQAQRPTMEAIIKELEKSLDFQKNGKDNFQMSFDEIKLATKHFSDYNCLGAGRFWKLYEGDNGCDVNIVKRWDSTSDPKYHHEFLTELEILFKHKHECIISLAGYCKEMDEKIIVYEHGYNRRLHKHLDDASLTWTTRLKIGIDVAKGLAFLHKGGVEQEEMKHRDIKSASILLNSNFRAKISNLELCTQNWKYEKVEHTSGDHAYSSLGYVDPTAYGLYLAKESDIYSLGVVLIEMLCGRLAWPEGCEDHSQSLGPLAISHFLKTRNLDEMIFEGIKQQIVPESLTTFQNIALLCLLNDAEVRPPAYGVVIQLKRALEFQEDIDIWDAKMPRDYNEIIKMSTTPDIWSTKTRKELYESFHKGILLQDGKVCFSLSNNEDINEMIPARMFSYENNKSHKWRSVHKSRFPKVVRMLDISNLKIQIKIKPQFLSKNVNYGAYLVFTLCDPRKFSNQPMYVNLKYKMGGETMHAYFATWRDDKWMMIELCRFLHDQNHSDFEVQLDSFSRYYCGNGAYIEGIEFRAIDDASLKVQSKVYEKIGVKLIDNHERTKLEDGKKVGNEVNASGSRTMLYVTRLSEKLKGVKKFFKFNSHRVQQRAVDYKEITKLEDDEQLFSKIEANLKKVHMLPAKMILSDSYDAKCFIWKSLPKSRFEEVAEFLSDQVFRIKCQIETQGLSSNTDYVCYLIFTLAQKCHGLQCPVKVRDILLRKNKESSFVYFRTPSSVNLHDTKRVPKLREDGLIEVIVWEFNSNKLNGDHIPMHLKLRCYEGTLCGLTVYGLEFRPI